MANQSVSVPVFALSQSSPDPRPVRPAGLTRRAIIVLSVALGVVIAIVAAIAWWPRPPTLTREELLDMLATNPLFDQTGAFSEAGALRIRDITEFSPEEVEEILSESATHWRTAFPGNPPGCPREDLEASLYHADAELYGDLRLDTGQRASFTLIHLDTAAQARIAARALTQCSAAEAVQYQPPDDVAERHSTFEPSLEELYEVDDHGLVFWPTQQTIQIAWTGDTTTGVQQVMLFQATIAYGNLVIVAVRDIVATRDNSSEQDDPAPWEAGDPFLTGLREAIDQAS